MNVRIAEFARLVYDAFELVNREVLTSSVDWDYLVLGKFLNFAFRVFFFLSFWCEGQIAYSFLEFRDCLINGVLLGTAEVAIEWANGFFSFFYSCDAFCSIAFKVCWYFFQGLLSRLIVSCEVFSIGICEATHEFEEAWWWIACRWGVRPSSYHTSDEWNVCSFRFWYWGDWSVLDTIESLVEVVPALAIGISSEDVVPSIVGIKDLVAFFN